MKIEEFLQSKFDLEQTTKKKFEPFIEMIKLLMTNYSSKVSLQQIDEK